MSDFFNNQNNDSHANELTRIVNFGNDMELAQFRAEINRHVIDRVKQKGLDPELIDMQADVLIMKQNGITIRDLYDLYEYNVMTATAKKLVPTEEPSL